MVVSVVLSVLMLRLLIVAGVVCGCADDMCYCCCGSC